MAPTHMATTSLSDGSLDLSVPVPTDSPLPNSNVRSAANATTAWLSVQSEIPSVERNRPILADGFVSVTIMSKKLVSGQFWQKLQGRSCFIMRELLGVLRRLLSQGHGDRARRRLGHLRSCFENASMETCRKARGWFGVSMRGQRASDARPRLRHHRSLQQPKSLLGR